MKAIKYVLYALGGVLLIVLAGVAYVSATFDPNKYKPEIIQLVKEQKQRTLKLDGDIKLTFFPKIGADLGRITLSEHKSEKEFAAVDSLRVSLALMPLLSRQAVVDEVSVKGLKVSLVRFKDGTSNFDDLLSKEETKSEAFKVDIEKVSITDTALSWKDEKAGQDIALSALNLTTGRVAEKVPGQFSLAVNVAGKSPKADGRVELAGGFLFDLAKQEFSFTGLTSKVGGSGFGVSGLDLALAGDIAARMAEQVVTAKSLKLDVKGAYGGDSFDVKLTSPALTANLKGPAVSAEKLELTATGKHGGDSGTIQASTGKLEADLGTKKLAVEGLTASGNGAFAGVKLSDAKVAAPRLTVNLAGGQIVADKVALAAKGAKGEDNFDLTLNAPRLEVSPEKAAGDAITAALKLSGKDRKVDADFKLAGVAGNAKALSIAKLEMKLDAASGPSTVAGTLASPFKANLEQKVFELPGIAAKFTVTDPNIPQKTVTLPIDGSVRADLGNEAVAADLSTRFDESNIKAKLSVSHFAKPAYGFDVDIDKLNVDRYFPPKPKGQGAPAGGAAPAGGGADQPIDLSALKELNANGSLKIGQFQANNIKLSNLRLSLKAGGGKVTVDPLAAGLYGGSAAGMVAVDANSKHFTLRQNLTGILVEPLLKDVADTDTLSGKGNVALDVTAQGATVGALKKALNGTAKLALADGAVKGIDVAGTIRGAKAKLASLKGESTQGADKTQKTDFSELSASFLIKNGVAHNDDLAMKAPVLRLGGEGDIDIGNEQLNYLAKATVVASSKGQGGADLDQLKGLTVPVKLTGPFAQPKYAIDWSGVAASLAAGKLEEKKEAAKEKLKDKLSEKLFGKSAEPAPAAAPAPAGAQPAPAPAPAPAESPKDKVKDKLKGLFK